LIDRVRVPLLPHRRHRAARRCAESLLGSVLSRRAADDGGFVQAVDTRPSSLVQQLHGRLRRWRFSWCPDWRQAAVRYTHPQDRGPSRSSSAGTWPAHAYVPGIEALDTRSAANHRGGSRGPRACVRALRCKRICRASTPDRLRRSTVAGSRGPNWFPDTGHDRRSRGQWPPRRRAAAGVLGALGRNPDSQEG